MTKGEYNQCVDWYADRVYRFILKNIKQVADAEDVVQNAFVALWQHHEEIALEKAKSWLFKTAYNNMIDQIRKYKRIDHVEVMPETASITNVQYTGISEILEKALAQLPEAQRSVILLRDYEGYPYDEIAGITGLSESQVKVYIFRARKFLKQHIGSIEKVL